MDGISGRPPKPPRRRSQIFFPVDLFLRLSCLEGVVKQVNKGKIMKLSLALLTGALVLSAPLPSFSQDKASNVIFIFDSSGSMKKPIEGGETRSQAAKQAMEAALAKMPAGAKPGLFMYGHRRAKDCTDIEMVSPPGANDAKAVARMISKSQPKGETPIAAALEAVAFYFAPLAGQSNSVVLVTDGIEECGGDPCAAARAIREAGTSLKAHVVGFTLNEKQRKTLQCIADETGGKYFDAQDANGLSDALAEVQKAVAETPPAPPEPVRERVFFDDFEGADLSEHWVVNNPNPDGYIVEKGNLLMVSGEVGGFNTTNGANIIQLERDLPDEDWDIHMTFVGKFKTLRDVIQVGLRTDEKNYLVASVYSTSYNTGSSASDNRGAIMLSLLKVSNGTETVTEKRVFGDNLSLEAAAAFDRKVRLTLTKRGRSYTALYRAEGEVDADGNQITYETDALTSLRSPGKLTLSASKWGKATGEFLVNIESVEIETVKAAP
ncbi:vWA domain-containing protein [Taklimakanibacter deserti]|uniref:vWA domain-containing protein n=1 Tax=Taklimakanibacter deserti TaxID=2267839 RepID=UPI000E65DDAE